MDITTEKIDLSELLTKEDILPVNDLDLGEAELQEIFAGIEKSLLSDTVDGAQETIDFIAGVEQEINDATTADVSESDVNNWLAGLEANDPTESASSDLDSITNTNPIAIEEVNVGIASKERVEALKKAIAKLEEA